MSFTPFSPLSPTGGVVPSAAPRSVTAPTPTVQNTPQTPYATPGFDYNAFMKSLGAGTITGARKGLGQLAASGYPTAYQEGQYYAADSPVRNDAINQEANYLSPGSDAAKVAAYRRNVSQAGAQGAQSTYAQMNGVDPSVLQSLLSNAGNNSTIAGNNYQTQVASPEYQANQNQLLTQLLSPQNVDPSQSQQAQLLGMILGQPQQPKSPTFLQSLLGGASSLLGLAVPGIKTAIGGASSANSIYNGFNPFQTTGS